ncbi:MAG: hypothetical protein JO260_01730 [Acidobacteria bacterium]|nr:hypothetical protein [Acidobacteriota bacterium]
MARRGRAGGGDDSRGGLVAAVEIYCDQGGVTPVMRRGFGEGDELLRNVEPLAVVTLPDAFGVFSILSEGRVRCRGSKE